MTTAPAPARILDDAPNKTSLVTCGAAGTPAPATAGAPAPASASAPTPATAGAPAPATAGAPTPATAGAATLPADAQRVAERAADALFSRDAASLGLGMQVAEVRPGYARVTMTVRPDMVNGHKTCHGGLIFSLADSAFAVSCNSHNESNVAASASIDFLAPAREGDGLTAEAQELWRSGRSGIYEVTVTNQRGERIALFRGRSHRIRGEVVPTDVDASSAQRE